MDKKILLIAFLLLAISTKEMMARDFLRAYREMHQRPKRVADGCLSVNTPCSAMPCEGLKCEGEPLGCYDGMCIPESAAPYKRKRSVNFPMEN
ncbi:hypothetical protein ACROYT_G010199 [Oculina patagonica]